jgi:hypothetical protein
MATTGWKLDARDRDALLARFSPRYAHTVADHVTLRFGTDGSTPLPAANGGEVIGEADDDHGVQALVVRIDGTTERGDGSHFHITWSLANERTAKESNDVIKAHGWRPVTPAIAIGLTPARWVG